MIQLVTELSNRTTISYYVSHYVYRLKGLETFEPLMLTVLPSVLYIDQNWFFAQMNKQTS